MNGREVPIGVSGSGFNGLTVMWPLVDQLPNEDFVYLGNTARAPYGPRPITQVREFAIWGLDYLAGRGVKMLVIACDPASSMVLRDARECYDVPILEVILLVTRRALATPGSSRVGVVYTEVTAISRFCGDAFTMAGNARLTIQTYPRFVGFVEAGITGGKELFGVAREYLAPLQAMSIDTLTLGCIRYPLLTGVINYALGGDVALVSSSDACTQNTYARPTRKGLPRDVPRHTSHQFLTTSDADSFQGTGGRLLGHFAHGVEQVGFH